MLQHLQIKDLGLVRTATLDFRAGLSVLSGESGSGKSTVLDALALIAGAARPRLGTRAGARSGLAEAEFHLEENPDGSHGSEALRSALEKHGLGVACAEGGVPLVLARRVEASGRTRCFIQGQTVSRAVLSDIGACLVELCGQSEAHGLKTKGEQLLLLDRFARVLPKRRKVERLVRQLTELEQKYETVRKEAGEAERRRDFLEYQLGELEAVHTDGVSEHRERLKELDQARKSKEAHERAVSVLSGKRSGVLGQLEVLHCELSHEDSLLEDSLAEAMERLRDVFVEARRLVDNSDDDEGERQELQERLEQMDSLAAKHRVTVEQLPSRRVEIEEELEACCRLEAEQLALKETVARLTAEAETAAEQLHTLRRKAASQLEKKLAVELAAVGLAGAVLETHLSRGKLTAAGITHLDIGFSANPGSPPQPLSRVASGGELSRILLCIRLATESSGALLVFDEIDAGAGGNTAEKIAGSMKRASASSQVLCATHWAQVAAVADSQFAVEKRTTNRSAQTLISPVIGEERLSEVSRMLGGTSKTARRHAEQLVSSNENGTAKGGAEQAA